MQGAQWSPIDKPAKHIRTRVLSLNWSLGCLSSRSRSASVPPLTKWGNGPFIGHINFMVIIPSIVNTPDKIETIGNDNLQKGTIG
jgi:hypothetical protein